MCRSLMMSYKTQEKYNRIPAYRFELDFGDFSIFLRVSGTFFFFLNISWLFPNTGNDVNGKSCFCRDVDECPPKGTIDLFRCNGSPMFISLPHFYLADPKLVKNIRSGLTPYEKSHESFILFELVQFLTMFWHRVQV